MTKTTRGVLALALYIATIFAANWAINHYGVVNVGFGLAAPAGVYFAGLAFTLRDATQENLGRWWVLVAIALGCGASALVNTNFAFASATAFLISELADFAVYTPLREKNLAAAVTLSNTVGIVLDSVIFLQLAFHNQDFLKGQIVGKAWMTVPIVLVLLLWRRDRRSAVAA
jgi:uncharacterized PurR-regulated membrane protein YhhQ (DUF165 family)